MNFDVSQEKKMKSRYHIILHTINSFPVWDKRGNGNILKEFYSQLNNMGIEIDSEKVLPIQYNVTKSNDVAVKFNDDQKNFIQTEICELIKPDGDRVAGDLDYFGIFVGDDRIDMFVNEDEEKVKQKISRIKSRIATLLSFEFPDNFDGKGTWSKGIWMAKLVGNVNISDNKIITTYNTCS